MFWINFFICYMEDNDPFIPLNQTTIDFFKTSQWKKVRKSVLKVWEHSFDE